MIYCITRAAIDYVFWAAAVGLGKDNTKKLIGYILLSFTLSMVRLDECLPVDLNTHE